MVVRGLVFTDFVDCGDGGLVRGVEGCSGSRQEGLSSSNEGGMQVEG